MTNPFYMLGQYMNMIKANPMLSNAVQLMNSGKENEVRKIAENFCASQGKDFNTEFRKFMASMREH